MVAIKKILFLLLILLILGCVSKKPVIVEENTTLNIENKTIEEPQIIIDEEVNQTIIDLPVDEKKEISKDMLRSSIVKIEYSVKGRDMDGFYFEKREIGSGVIWKKEGATISILTNRHSIDCGSYEECYQRSYEKIKVVFADGNSYNPSKIKFADKNNDVAEIQIIINKKEMFIPELKEAMVGDKIKILGYPSYDIRVVDFLTEDGKISGINKFIESDAYAAFGVSSGALFDEHGNLLGINIWKNPASSTKESAGLSIQTIMNYKFISACENGYLLNGNCVTYCEQSKILGSDSKCYSSCNEFYCESEIPDVQEATCQNKAGYIYNPGTGYCHPACGAVDSICPNNNICFKNKCAICPESMQLYKDGNCKIIA